MVILTDHASIIKFEKSSYDEIKKDIFEVAQEMGIGATDPVPYDTAWVAQVPDIKDLSSPAFPKCLQWLRDNQMEDGSWGVETPFSPHSKIINTFASVLAFSQWNYSEDEDRKQRGINALTRLAKSLPQKETNDLTFEMILAGFLDDARALNLSVPYECLEWCFTSSETRRQKIQSEIISNESREHWAYLEVSCRALDLEVENYRSEITQYGLIAGQPSTTAYILRYARLKGNNFPEAEWTLAKLCSQNKGGMPHLSPCDNFEIVHVLDFLFKAAINPSINIKHVVTKTAENTLRERLNCGKGIGLSSKSSVVDYECSKMAVNIVQSLSKNEGSKDCNTDPVSSERENRTATKSTFLNCSDSSENNKGLLKTYSLNRLLNYTKNGAQSNLLSFPEKSFISNKRNLSVYYHILQETFRSADHESKNIIHIIGKTQNKDGGWGNSENSTVEETAYACLTIFFLVQKHPKALRCFNLSGVTDFLNKNDSPPSHENFWCFKVNFRPIIVSKAALVAAKYALILLYRHAIMTAAFKDSKLECLDIEFWERSGQFLCQGYFLSTYPKVDRQDIEVDKQEIINTCKDILKVNLFDPHVEGLMDTCIECSYLCHSAKISAYDRAIETLQLVGFLIADDIFDFYLVGKNNLIKELHELLSVWKQILMGDYASFEAVPTLSFPRFPLLSKWFFCYRNIMEQKGWRPESFLKLLSIGVINSAELGYKLQCYSIVPTTKRYLQISKLDVGLMDISHQNSIIEDKNTDSTEFEHYKLFTKYRDCACKATRILSDVPSALKDVNESKTDNYCLQIQKEYKVPLHEAMKRAIKKGNKEILKMLCFKKLIIEDPEYKDNENLLRCMKHIQNCLDGIVLWALSTFRYQVGWKVSCKRVSHETFSSKFTWDIYF